MQRYPGYRTSWPALLLGLVALHSHPAGAGEIPGMPPALLPLIERDAELTFSNDFLGRGGSVDDFRTQQFDITAMLGDKWLVVADYSILTLENSPDPGRLDQLSASLGYQLFNRVAAQQIDQLTIGGGVRSVGNYAGEQVQNGFHRLLGNRIKSLPYVETHRNDLTGWVEAQRYRELRDYGTWSTGYWLRAASLVTSDGQLDSAASAMAVASRGALLDIWLGLRQDWRNGYDADNVQTETAHAEDDTSIVVGLRYGALVIETVQQLNNDASYGQISLVSSGFRQSNLTFAEPEASVELGFLLPDVQIQLVGKRRSSFFPAAGSAWREAVLLDLRYGEPQDGNNESSFINTRQLGAGMEWERNLPDEANWLSVYGALGGGWRTEQVDYSQASGQSRSDTVGRAVVTGAAGLRVNTTSLSRSWNYRLQLGLSAWAPLSDAHVELNGEEFTIQQPALAVVLGMTFDYAD